MVGTRKTSDIVETVENVFLIDSRLGLGGVLLLWLGKGRELRARKVRILKVMVLLVAVTREASWLERLFRRSAHHLIRKYGIFELRQLVIERHEGANILVLEGVEVLLG